MRFYVMMEKINETCDFVSYKFETDIIVTTYPDDQNREFRKTKVVFGYCTFDKRTGDFTLNEEKSDPFFLKDSEHILIVWSRLLKVFQSGENFPEAICYAA